jgi:hypothetical protein
MDGGTKHARKVHRATATRAIVERRLEDLAPRHHACAH